MKLCAVSHGVEYLSLAARIESVGKCKADCRGKLLVKGHEGGKRS